MRHQKSRLRLRHKPAHSRSLQRNIVTSVLLYESIRTTKKRAEVVRPLVDRLIHIAKTRPTHIAIRAINAVVNDKNACRKTMEVLKQRYAARTSGFTRMIPLGARHGDGAELVTLQLIDAEKAVVVEAAKQQGKEGAAKKNQKSRTAKKTSAEPSVSESSPS